MDESIVRNWGTLTSKDRKCRDCAVPLFDWDRSLRCDDCKIKRERLLRKMRDSSSEAYESGVRRKERDPFGRRVFGTLG